MNGLNLYNYCFNNPIRYCDHGGFWPKKLSINTSSNISEWRNKNGSCSLYDNDRFEDKTPFHEQIFVINSSDPTFDLREGNIGLGSISFTLITGGWEWKHYLR